MKHLRLISNTRLAAGLCGALASLFLAGAQAQAQSTIVINHSDREAVNNPEYLGNLSGRFKVVGGSYQARAWTNLDGLQDAATRPYFIFPLGSIPSGTTISEIKLRIFHPTRSYDSPDPTEDLTFFSIDRATVSQLRALKEPTLPNGDPDTPSASQLAELGRIFKDLGDGTNYGKLVGSPAKNGKYQTVTLNQNAVDDLNRAIREGKSEFALGGDITSIIKGQVFPQIGQTQRIFKASDGSAGTPKPPTNMILTVEGGGSTPAPVLGGAFGVILLGTGLGGVGLRSRRRRRHG